MKIGERLNIDDKQVVSNLNAKEEKIIFANKDEEDDDVYKMYLSPEDYTILASKKHNLAETIFAIALVEMRQIKSALQGYKGYAQYLNEDQSLNKSEVQKRMQYVADYTIRLANILWDIVHVK